MGVNFTIMTWNIENLFPVGHASGPKTKETYDHKMATLAYTISSINPDVLGLQEVGDPVAFGDLLRRLGDQYPYKVLSSFPDRRGIRVGLVSKRPLVQIKEMFAFPKGALTSLTDADGDLIKTMGRGVLKATIVLAPGLLINVVNMHLKSKLITYENGRRYPLDENERARETGVANLKRTAEAVAVRVFINDLVVNNAEPLIAMGDFNDSGESVSSQIMFGPEDRSLTRADKLDDVRLYNLDEYIALDRRFSRLYLKRRELIDHIAVSHELVFRRRQVDSFVEPIENIDNDTEWRRDATFPDHAPIFARFYLETGDEQDNPQ